MIAPIETPSGAAQAEREMPVSRKRTIRVSHLRISTAVSVKLSSKHGLDAESVRQALVGVSGLAASAIFDEERGFRWAVRVPVDGRPCLAILFPSPSDPDAFALGSCYPK